MRGANEGFRKFLADDAPRRFLMRGIEEAVEKTDCDGFGTCVAQNADRVAHRGLVECGFDAPVVAQSLRHFAAQPALDQHGRFVRLKIVKFGAFLPADFEQVAKAVAGDQTGRGTTVLDQRIGRHCRAVAEIGNIACLRGDLGERFANPHCDRVRGISGGRGNFPNRDLAALFVEQADIGEGAAGIDADPPRHWSVPVAWIRRR